MRIAAVLVCAMLALAARASAAPDAKSLYAGACASCHGGNLEGNLSHGSPAEGARGVPGAGPPLRGVGALAADFYLRTGYMPLSDPRAQPRRRESPFAPKQLDALIAYVGSFGGPGVPRPHPERGSLSDGLRLFTENCAGCHQIVGRGGVVTDAVAPTLEHATATQIAEAVRIGPYVMPSFSQTQVSDRELDSIIRYVRYARHPDDRGGWAIGNIGPIPEGMVAWLIAGAALIAVTLVIGSRRKGED
jgi:ubiquinol-cytochrome c reductase cytochrome c subunit